MPETENETITRLQQALPPVSSVTQPTRDDLLRNARWWELEAARGYGSSAKSLEYAHALRSQAERVP